MCHQCWCAAATLGSPANCHSAGCGRGDNKLKKPWLNTHTTTTRVIRKCYSSCKNTSTLQRVGYQLRTVPKSVIGVIQKAVPDGLTGGRLIWEAVWTQSTSSLAQISSAPSSLSGSHLEAFQHVQVAPVYLWHHSTASDESQGGKCIAMINSLLPRGSHLSFSVLNQRRNERILT